MGSTDVASSTSLKAVVVGGGISGLTAAIGLRRQGHQVHVLERSSLLKEYGAAISIGPNASAVLRRLGVFLEEYKAVEFDGYSIYQNDKLVKEAEGRQSYYTTNYNQPYHLILRQHLHHALIEKATESGGQGPPATITTSAKVVNVDSQAGKVTLDDGRTFEADLVVGADGLHSYARHSIPGAEDIKEQPTGSGVYRCLIPRQALIDDPLTRHLAERDGHTIIWVQTDPAASLIIYHCDDGKTMNVAANTYLAHFTPEELAARANISVDHIKAEMLEEYGKHSKSMEAMVKHIDSVGLWAFADTSKIPAMANGRLAVIGDAAHPFLPHLGQGGAIAIEDGASIAALLPPGTKVDDVPARLKLFEQARYERGHAVQQRTRDSDAGKAGLTEHPIFGDGGEFTKWLYGYDAWAESEKLLPK